MPAFRPDQISYWSNCASDLDALQELSLSTNRYIFLTHDLGISIPSFEKNKVIKNIQMVSDIANVSHRFFIMEYSKDGKYHETLGFYTRLKDCGFIEYVMCHIDILEKFFIHFKLNINQLEQKHIENIKYKSGFNSIFQIINALI